MLEQFLAPSCTPRNLDTFLVRSAILRALQDTTRYFSGTLLDVGCGYMPYKSLVLAPPSRATRYIGLDLERSTYGEKPDLLWDGNRIPLPENVVDCALATEVFEHCPSPEIIMGETLRVLKPGGLLFFTVPFLWPLHEVPHDEYRYTPFALERHLRNSGFTQIKLKALGGWDASLAQTIGLWVIRRPMSSRKRAILSRLALPIIRYLARRDRLSGEFGEGLMITGLSGTAIKPLVKCRHSEMRNNGALRVERQSEFPAVCGCPKETPIAWLPRCSGLSHGNILANRIHTILFMAEERENISTIHISAIGNF